MGTISGSHARFLVSLLSHYKVKRAGSLATHMWMFAVLWANDHPGRDGRVPLDIVLDLLPDVAKGTTGERDPTGAWNPITPLDVVHRCIEAGWFDPIEQEHGIGEVVPIHDYLDHNKSGAERAAGSAMKAEAARRRHGTAPPTAHDPGTGRFTANRAAASPQHAVRRARRTGKTVPTSATDTSPDSTTPAPFPHPQARYQNGKLEPISDIFDQASSAVTEETPGID